MPPPADSPPSQQFRTGWILAGLAVIAVLALGNRSLLLGRAAPQWDAADYFGPSFTLVGDAIRAGHLLTWNPWVNGGSPDWAEPQLGTTSPVLLAFSFLSPGPQAGYIVYWLAVWAWGGIGMLLLARHLGAPAWGGAIAALGFISSGFYTGHAEHIPWLYSISFLPWILWRLDAGLRHSDWRCGVQAGALYGLSILGGYPGFAILTPGFLLLWALGRFLQRGARSTGGRTAAARFTAALLFLLIAVGSLIGCVPAWGMLKGARGYTDRAGPRTRPSATSDNLLPAGALTTFASPYLADLNLPPGPLWPQTDIAMTSIYAGAISLMLAAFALRRRDRWCWWLAALVGLALCCALGSQLPLRGWLYDFVPPTRYFRHPSLFRAYVIQLIAILAALATRDLAEEGLSKRDRKWLWSSALIWACAAGASFFLVVRLAGKSMPQFHAAILHLAVVWFGFAALAYLFYGGLPGAIFARLAVALALFDAAGALYIAQPVMYTRATVPLWRAMSQWHVSGLDPGLDRAPGSPEFLGPGPASRNVVVKAAALDNYVTLWNRFLDGINLDPQLSRMATGAGRLWFTQQAARRAPDDAAFQSFRQRVHELHGAPVLLLHSREQMFALLPHDTPSPRGPAEHLDIPACVPATVSNLAYRPDSLSFEYSAPAHGYLLVTDRWADGWEVTVNGRERPVLGADFIFRAVEVDAGRNAIQFTYNPPGFWPLLLLSWGTLLGVAGWQCCRWLRR